MRIAINPKSKAVNEITMVPNLITQKKAHQNKSKNEPSSIENTQTFQHKKFSSQKDFGAKAKQDYHRNKSDFPQPRQSYQKRNAPPTNDRSFPSNKQEKQPYYKKKQENQHFGQNGEETPHHQKPYSQRKSSYQKTQDPNSFHGHPHTKKYSHFEKNNAFGKEIQDSRPTKPRFSDKTWTNPALQESTKKFERQKPNYSEEDDMALDHQNREEEYYDDQEEEYYDDQEEEYYGEEEEYYDEEEQYHDEEYDDQEEEYYDDEEEEYYDEEEEYDDEEEEYYDDEEEEYYNEEEEYEEEEEYNEEEYDDEEYNEEEYDEKSHYGDKREKNSQKTSQPPKADSSQSKKTNFKERAQNLLKKKRH